MTRRKKCAFIFPGQGAQYPKMGFDFFENFAEARDTFLEADELLARNFSRLIFEGEQQELTKTHNAQLAIFITSVALFRVFSEENREYEPMVTAGLSLGEYTALVASNRLSFEDCLLLVQSRGSLMHEASLREKGTMQVVLGYTREEVAEGIKGIAGVWIANLNCPGQVVISGTLEGVSVAAEKLKELGAKRVLPLDVSGAFHSPLMFFAKEKLEPQILSIDVADSEISFVMNVTGSVAKNGDEVKKNLVDQVTSPVLWQKSIDTMVAMEPDIFIEVGPGKSLSGMNKKIGVTIPTCNVEKIDDLECIVC